MHVMHSRRLATATSRRRMEIKPGGTHMNELQMMNAAMDTIHSLGKIPFADASKVQVNDSMCDLLRELKRAMNNVTVNAPNLAKDYPYEFRATLSQVHSIAGAELQDFEQQEKQNGTNS
jgi:hypothetical protein